VFILYPVVIGLLVGVLLGGRISGLADVRFRWGALALAGLLVQVVLFSDQVSRWIGGLGPPLYVASTALVLGVLLRNLAIPGLPLVALGAASNFTAIVANGGYMPASPAALAALGHRINPGYSNSAILPDAALAPLTDVFALPSWLPFANVFSIGDVLIGVGVSSAIVIAMRRAGGAPRNLPPTYTRTGTDVP
jgi:hypothetical protein